MVRADTVLVADGPAAGHDRLTDGVLQAVPAGERPVGVIGDAEHERRVQARAARVDVREMAEGVDPFALIGEPAAERRGDRAGQPGDARPVGRRLDGIHCVAGLPQGAAPVWRAGTLRPPAAADDPFVKEFSVSDWPFFVVVLSQVIIQTAHALGAVPIAANIIGVVLATPVGYVLNRTWVWKRRGASDLAREVAPSSAM